MVVVEVNPHLLLVIRQTVVLVVVDMGQVQDNREDLHYQLHQHKDFLVVLVVEVQDIMVVVVVVPVVQDKQDKEHQELVEKAVQVFKFLLQDHQQLLNQ